MKREALSLALAFPGELIIENFAGNGGTSTRLEVAFGRPDLATNHNSKALAMHGVPSRVGPQLRTLDAQENPATGCSSSDGLCDQGARA